MQKKNEMNYHLISDPLVIHFCSKKSSVKMAEVYQTKDTTTIHIKIKVFVIKMSFFIEFSIKRRISISKMNDWQIIKRLK